MFDKSIINKLDLNKYDEASQTIGNKANNLLLMKKMDINIPDSWIIESSIPAYILKKEGIYDNGVELEDFHKARDILLNNLENEYKILIFNAVKSIIKKNFRGSFVVRSSSIVEDSEKYSFAGMFTTIVNVNKTMNIVNSIITIWADGFSSGIYEMCKKNNIKKLEPCAVILQEMINSKIGGVTFKDDSNLCVNAVYGQTKSIVDGISEPDQWIFDKNNMKLIKTICGNKECGLFPIFLRVNPLPGEKVKFQIGKDNYIGECLKNEEKEDIALAKIAFPEELRKSKTISNEEIIRLIFEFEKVGKLMKFDDYDIEWCINQENQLYFLQIRKVTRNTYVNDRINISQAIPLVRGFASGLTEYVATNKDAIKFKKGSILLTEKINGAVIHASAKASGCIVESNSVLSHSAIIARELGIPCIGIKSIDMIEKGKYYKINGEDGSYQMQNEKYKEELNEFDRFEGNNLLKDYEKKSFFDDLIVIPSEWLVKCEDAINEDC